MRTSMPVLVLAMSAGCYSTPKMPTRAEQRALADSARAAVQALLNSGSARDGAGYAARLSADADAKYAAAGNLAGSAAELGKELGDSKQVVDSVAQNIDEWFPAVVGPDAVAFTAAYRFSAVLKGRPQPLAGTGIFSGVVQRRQGKWRIIQYHESYNKQDEILGAYAAALNTGANEKK